MRRVDAPFDHLVKQLRSIAKRRQRLLRRRVLQQIVFPQHAVGHAQRVFHRGRTAWHGNIREVRKALERHRVAQQRLAAPNSTIHAVARAIERKAKRGLDNAVFRQRRHNVRMVMLRFHARQLLLARPFRSQILRMLIASKQRQRYTEKTLVALNRFKPRVVDQGIFHITHMLRHKRIAFAQETRRGFLLGARCANARIFGCGKRIRQMKWCGRIAACTAHKLQRGARLPKVQNAHHGVVITRTDRAIVAQNGIRNAPKRTQRFSIIGHNRFIVHIPRGHNKHTTTRRSKIMHEQHLQRRVRKHHAQLVQMICQPRRKLNRRLQAQQHNRAHRTA